MAMNESDLWITQCGIVHLLEEPSPKGDVVVRDDPVRALHVTLDHQIPGSAGTDVRRHMNHRDLANERVLPSCDIVKFGRDLS